MPANIAPAIDLTARTFDVLRERALDLLKRRVGSFRYNAMKATDIVPAIIDVLSWFHEQNANYYDRLQRNSLLILADTREAMIPLALAQGYRMRPATSASVAVIATPQPPQAAPITLRAGTRVAAGDLTFEIALDAVIPAGRTTWPDGTTDDVISLVEGLTKNESFVSDGSKFQPFELGLPGTIDGSVRVTILGEVWEEVASLVFVEGDRRGRDSFQGTGLDSQQYVLSLLGAVIAPEDEDKIQIIVTPLGGESQVWRQVDTLTGAPREYTAAQTPSGVTTIKFGLVMDGAAPGVNDNIDIRYLIAGAQKRYQLTYDQDDRATIRFGDDVTGIIPPAGATIQVTYRTGGGVRGNIAVGKINELVLGELANGSKTGVLLRNLEAGSGGNPPETVDHARFFAPRVAKSKERGVAKEDWTALAATYFDPLYGAPAHASAFLKQRNPELNTVQVAVWGRDSNGNLTTAGTPLKLGMRNFLQSRRVINTRVEMIDGRVILMDIEVDIVLELGAVRQAVFAAVTNAITQFFQSADVMPGADLSIGKLYKTIQNVAGVERSEIIKITGAVRASLTTKKPDGTPGVADGVTNLFSGQFTLLEGTAILPRSVVVTDGVQQVVDNGEGGFDGDVLAGLSDGDPGDAVDYETGVFSAAFLAVPPIGRIVTAEARLAAFFGKVEVIGQSDGSFSRVDGATLYYPIIKRAPRGLWSGDPHLVIDGFVIPNPPGTTIRGRLPRGILPGTLTIQDAVAGVNTVATDNGVGVILVNAIPVGNVDYTTGDVNFDFPVAVAKPVRATWQTRTMDFFLPADLLPLQPGRVFIWGGFGADGAQTPAELLAYDDGAGNIAGNVLAGGQIDYQTGLVRATWNTNPPPGPGAGNEYYATFLAAGLPFDGVKRRFDFAIQGLPVQGISRFAPSNLDRGEGRTRLQLSDLSTPGFSVLDAFDNWQGKLHGTGLDRVGVNTLIYTTGLGTLTFLTPPPALPVPASAPLVAMAAGGSVNPGLHQWAYTHVTNGVESAPSPLSTPPTNVLGGTQTANLSGIANGPVGTTAKNIYRYKAGGNVLFKVGTIPDNVTTVFVDTFTDASLTNPAPPYFRVRVTNVATVLYAGFVFFVKTPAIPGLDKGLFADNTGRFWGPPAAGPANAFPTDQLDHLRGRYHADLAGAPVAAGRDLQLTYDALTGVPPALDLVMGQNEVPAVGRISLIEKAPEVLA
jgi:hypothetical protein